MIQAVTSEFGGVFFVVEEHPQESDRISKCCSLDTSQQRGGCNDIEQFSLMHSFFPCLFFCGLYDNNIGPLQARYLTFI